MCIDFPDHWTGLRVRDGWDSSCAGGTPTKASKEAFIRYAKNPQYKLTLTRQDGDETEFFISLGQEDGRLINGMAFPYKEHIHPVAFGVFRLEPGEEKLA